MYGYVLSLVEDSLSGFYTIDDLFCELMPNFGALILFYCRNIFFMLFYDEQTSAFL